MARGDKPSLKKRCYLGDERPVKIRQHTYYEATPFCADLSHEVICSWFTNPACCCTNLPFEKTMKLGMPRTLYRAESSGNFSVSTLTTIAFPVISAAVRATSGAAMRHGPHHPAQKSTRTGTRA